MMIRKWTKLLLISASVIALAACSSAQKGSEAGSGGHNVGMAYNNTNDSAQTSGLGSESSFNGEQVSANNQQQLHTTATATAQRIYYFDFDKYSIHDEYKTALESHANYLVAHRNVRILVEGHTDPRGSREYNIGLGERRANAIVAELTAKGVNPNQIRVVSYGAEKLASFGRNDEDYQKDRRAVLVFAQE